MTVSIKPYYIDKNTLPRLSHEEQTDLTNFGITILDE